MQWNKIKDWYCSSIISVVKVDKVKTPSTQLRHIQ